MCVVCVCDFTHNTTHTLSPSTDIASLLVQHNEAFVDASHILCLHGVGDYLHLSVQLHKAQVGGVV